MKKLLFGLLILYSCQSNHKIEPGDKVVTCIIDSMSILRPISVLDIQPKYYYYTDCGTKFSCNSDNIYKIGDTITYVYKKVK
jgi:hypothetical protein